MVQPENRRLLTEARLDEPGGVPELDGSGLVKQAQLPTHLTPAALNQRIDDQFDGELTQRGLPANEAALTDKTAGMIDELALTQRGGEPYPTQVTGETLAGLRGSDVQVPLPSPDGYDHIAFPAIAKVGENYVVVARAATGHSVRDGKLALWTTESGGRGWSDPTILDVTDLVTDPLIDTAYDARDPGLTVLPSGDLLMVWYDAGPRRSYWSLSSDAGATWSTPTVLPFGWTDTQYCSAPICITPSGAWLVAAYGEDTGDSANRKVRIIRSTDAGSSWTTVATLNVDADSTLLVEPNLVATGGTNLMMLSRAMDGTWVYRSTSSDDGVTWAAPTKAFMGTGNTRMVRLRNGRIAVAYRSLEKALRPRRNEGQGVAVRVTQDDGITWSRATTVAIWRAMVYMSMVETDRDNSILAVWGREESDQSIVYATYLGDGSAVTPLGTVPSDATPRPGIAGQSLSMRLNANFGPITELATGGVYDIPWDVNLADDWNGHPTPGSIWWTVNETGFYIATLVVQFDFSVKGPGCGIRNASNGYMIPVYNTLYLDAPEVSGQVRSNRVMVTAPVYLTEGTSYKCSAWFSLATGVTRNIAGGGEAYATSFQLVKLKGITAG